MSYICKIFSNIFVDYDTVRYKYLFENSDILFNFWDEELLNPFARALFDPFALDNYALGSTLVFSTFLISFIFKLQILVKYFLYCILNFIVLPAIKSLYYIYFLLGTGYLESDFFHEVFGGIKSYHIIYLLHGWGVLSMIIYLFLIFLLLLFYYFLIKFALYLLDQIRNNKYISYISYIITIVIFLIITNYPKI